MDKNTRRRRWAIEHTQPRIFVVNDIEKDGVKFVYKK